ncbi:unnamed protein product [Adineta steineri]|uniref:Uncharacterized protein n=1 Tax=Adineta steineri TaxID=433720 RepID=A0A815MQM5_9BILA|nr:unnamed protein product [Adineta steineri]CAF1620286.1 unnamed protein product [Adineta steineri]
MSQFILIGLLLTLIVYTSADLCLHGEICGNSSHTFCCPTNTRCGISANRRCYSQSNGPTLAGIIFTIIISLFIFIMILRACIACCSSRNDYDSIQSSDPAYLSRSGAVVCAVATSHC